MPTKPKTVLMSDYASKFVCIGATCEDTCCTGWSIDVDEETHAKYLRKRGLKDVSFTSADNNHFMRCDSNTGYCEQNNEGWCNIQQQHGEEYLSETCYFFPRTLRKIDDQLFMGISLSCPEAAKSVLLGNTPLIQRTASVMERKIKKVPNRAPQYLNFEMAMEIHTQIITALQNPDLTIDQQIGRLIALCYALSETEQISWHAATTFYMNSLAPSPPSPPRTVDNIHILLGLFSVAVTLESQFHPRLYRTIRDIEKSLHVQLHWENGVLDYRPDNTEAVDALLASWPKYKPHYEDFFRKWLINYAINNVLPFAGLGVSPKEQAYFLVIYYASLRLAVMSACYLKEAPISEDEVVRIFQSISRLYDQIVDAEIFFTTFDDPHWKHESSLRAIIGI
ncbi:MAG: flagellin lysine-N-methylase [Alphaproteobacteria bacterium]|nr:flagellin lysine-N-methylase [Alphaproteobacteria bacterium]